jgi:ketosteroid isomerase-like protein
VFGGGPVNTTVRLLESKQLDSHHHKAGVLMRRNPVSLAVMVLLTTPLIVAAQSTPTVLEIGKSISRQLLGDNRDVFQVNLQPGQFLHLSVMQDGVDVLITVFHPDGTKLLNVDSPIGKLGLEVVRFVADAAGAYRIEIHSASETEKGKYDIEIKELRPARPEEKKQSSEIQTLTKLNAERLRAESREDKNTLFRIYADEVLVVSPNNRSSIGERRAILGAARPSPHQSIEETMKIDNVKVLLSEDTAVVSSIVDVNWKIGEQRLTIKTCYSDTYVKRSDRWQLLATHMALVDSNPSKATVIKLDPKLLDEYAGVYQLSPTIRLKVYRKGDKLIMEGVDGSAYDLMPESADSFVIRGTPGKRIFVRDSNGKVTHLLFSTRGQELRAVKDQ